jgi:anaphase-promoting complex subunit 4
LQIDSASASISPNSYSQPADTDSISLEDGVDAVPSTLLVVTDDNGHFHCWLDGSYPIGSSSLKTLGLQSVNMLDKSRGKALFTAYAQADKRTLSCSVSPTYIHIPLLDGHSVRNMARLSTTARELSWYIMRVVQDMKVQWCGSESMTGANRMGTEWLAALNSKQQEHFGRKSKFFFLKALNQLAADKSNTILELTLLLLTGRASEGILDFFGSAEQMSERV